jgi:hypothetical protein
MAASRERPTAGGDTAAGFRDALENAQSGNPKQLSLSSSVRARASRTSVDSGHFDSLLSEGRSVNEMRAAKAEPGPGLVLVKVHTGP